MKRFIQNNIGLLIIPACLFTSALALGQTAECSEDADCGEGQLCQKGMSVGGCTVEPDSAEPADCNSEPQEAETGFCYTPPTACDTDADCGEYLSCLSASDGDCAVDSDGNTFCSEPDGDAAKYCTVASTPCETSDECPRDFECLDVTLCLAIDCIEGDESCLDACESNGQKQCQPKQIACDDSADCPSDWSCMGNVVEDCGGTDAGSGEGSSEGTEGNSDVAPDETTCTREPAVGSCYPDAWGGGPIYTADDILEQGADEDGSGSVADPTSGDAEAASAGGGCSVARAPGQPDASWALGLLLALPLVRRRRIA